MEDESVQTFLGEETSVEYRLNHPVLSFVYIICGKQRD